MGRSVGVVLTVCVLTAATHSALGQEPAGRLLPGPFGLSSVAPEPVFGPAGANFDGDPDSPAPPPCMPMACRDCCCQGTWQFFGEALYLRPGQDKVPYAVPINGPVIPPSGTAPVQVGRTATADVDFDPGFRAGLSYGLGECSRLEVMYSQLDAQVRNSVSVDVPHSLQPMVMHPATLAAPTYYLDATAEAAIRFRLADIDYRHEWLCTDRMSFGYTAGLRYAHLGQTFDSVFTSTGVDRVDTRLLFDGGGLRLGLEGQRRIACSSFWIYGSGAASFLGGQFTGEYTQTNNLNGTVVATGWKDDRIVPILDLELGVAWVGCHDHLRVSGGYVFSSWFNVPKTADFITAVQTNDFDRFRDALTFDGLALRAELRF